MATQLFFRGSPDQPFTRPIGANDTLLTGTISDWRSESLKTTRGAGVLSISWPTATGPTNGLDARASSGNTMYREWITDPLDANTTISGTVTCNLWMSESSMNANVGPQVVVDRLDANLEWVSNVLNTQSTAELGTSSAVNNWTASPTSTNFIKGDRIRIRVAGNDATGFTMASGFTMAFAYDTASAGVSGDSYVTFTENFGFITAAPSGSIVYLTNTAASGGLTDANTGATASMDFLSDATGWLLQNWYVPGGSVAAAQSVGWQSGQGHNANGCLEFVTTSSPSDQAVVYPLSGRFVAGVTYSFSCWMRVSSGSNECQLGIGSMTNGEHGSLSINSFAQMLTTSWVQKTLTLTPKHDVNDPAIHFASYGPVANTFWVDEITITASNSTMVEKEAWTSRGAGIQTIVTNNVTGRTPAIIMTVSGGGAPVEWFTRPLQAATLSGRVTASLRALNSSASSSNAAIWMEIAVTDGDGSNQQIYGSTVGTARITGTTETAYLEEVCGNDLAITNGQRIRIRLGLDDHDTTYASTSGTMVSGQNPNFRYAGTSGGASGDSFLTFPITLTEYVAADPRTPAGNRQGPQLLAH